MHSAFCQAANPAPRQLCSHPAATDPLETLPSPQAVHNRVEARWAISPGLPRAAWRGRAGGWAPGPGRAAGASLRAALTHHPARRGVGVHGGQDRAAGRACVCARVLGGGGRVISAPTGGTAGGRRGTSRGHRRTHRHRTRRRPQARAARRPPRAAPHRPFRARPEPASRAAPDPAPCPAPPAPRPAPPPPSFAETCLFKCFLWKPAFFNFFVGFFFF